MNDRVKIQKCVTTLKFKLSDKEKLAKGELLADLDGQLAAVEADFERAKDKHKSVAGGLETQITRAMQCIRTGTEMREVECDEVLDYDAGTVEYVYEGVTMEKRAMRHDERQLRIA